MCFNLFLSPTLVKNKHLLIFSNFIDVDVKMPSTPICVSSLIYTIRTILLPLTQSEKFVELSFIRES